MKTASFGDPVRLPLSDIREYWKTWASKQSAGEPFFFYTSNQERSKKREAFQKGQGENSEVEDEDKEGEGDEEKEDEDKEGEGDEEKEDEDKEGEGDEEKEDEEQNKEGEEQQNGAEQPPIPTAPVLEIDSAIPLPCQCDTSPDKIACLNLLTVGWDDDGIAFKDLINKVDTLVVRYLFAVLIRC